MKLSPIVSICAVILVTIVSAPAVHACIHARKDGPVVKQPQFRVALAHVKGTQTIVIQPTISTTESTDFGWVFPVPNLPTKMDTADKKVLRELSRDLFPQPKVRQKKSKSISKGPRRKVTEPPLKVHASQQVGPFEITPIEGGYNGVSGWLKKHNYTDIPEDHLKPYLDKGWVILAAKVSVENKTKKDKKSIGIVELGLGLTLTDLPPIVLQFKSDAIVFPWMFERTKQVADFEFLLFTDRKLAPSTVKTFAKTHEDDRVDFSSLKGNKAHKHKFKRNALKTKAQKNLMKMFGFSSKQTIHADRIRAAAVSHDDAIAKKLPDFELALSTKSSKKKKTKRVPTKK